MSNRTRPTFSQKSRLEAAQLVVNQGRSIRDTAEAMDGWIFRSVKTEPAPSILNTLPAGLRPHTAISIALIKRSVVGEVFIAKARLNF
jgi:hypothetical protein